MKKPVTAHVKECIQKATEVVLEESKEVNLYKITEILEKEYHIRFFNMEVLQSLVKEALNEIVYSYCE